MKMIPRVPFKDRLVEIVKGESNKNRAAAKMGISRRNLSYLLSPSRNADAEFSLVVKIKRSLGLPAALALYRESDGTLVDLGSEDFEEIVAQPDYLPKAILECRLALGLTQRQLADGSLLLKKDISRYETGKVRPFTKTMERMSLILQVVPVWLPWEIYRVHPGYVSGTAPELATALAINP